MGPPVSGEASWVPDPTGRHELRWWDGTYFTDHVADAGATGSDPYRRTAPSTPTTANPALPPDVTGRKASKLPVILATLGAFVVVLALLVLLTAD